MQFSTRKRRGGNFEAAIPGDSLSPLFYFCPLLIAVLHWQCCPSWPSSLFLVRTSYTLPSNQFKSHSNSWWLWHQSACVLPLGPSWRFPTQSTVCITYRTLHYDTGWRLWKDLYLKTVKHSAPTLVKDIEVEKKTFQHFLIARFWQLTPNANISHCC